ncbi:MAG: energy transducer TonB [Alistipes sp.]|nr:energy transducer TonB [Alistipes sp.]
MKRLFLIATFALAALTAYAQQKDPLYIINECVVSASEVQELTSQGHIDVLTVVRDANELKEYERFGDTSNGVILVTLKEEHVFIAPETPGEFMGGNIETFQKWVAENLRYPEEMKNQKASEVRIVVKFTIGKHGYIVPSSIEFLRGSVKALNDEVRRVLLSSPRWEPGKQKGEPVAVSYMLPVIFIWH